MRPDFVLQSGSAKRESRAQKCGCRKSSGPGRSRCKPPSCKADCRRANCDNRRRRRRNRDVTPPCHVPCPRDYAPKPRCAKRSRQPSPCRPPPPSEKLLCSDGPTGGAGGREEGGSGGQEEEAGRPERSTYFCYSPPASGAPSARQAARQDSLCPFVHTDAWWGAGPGADEASWVAPTPPPDYVRCPLDPARLPVARAKHSRVNECKDSRRTAKGKRQNGGATASDCSQTPATRQHTPPWPCPQQHTPRPPHTAPQPHTPPLARPRIVHQPIRYTLSSRNRQLGPLHN